MISDVVPLATETYRCLACRHEFKDRAGPTECPACGHLYVKWLDYEEHFGGKT